VASREELLGIGVGRGGAGHMQRVAELDRAQVRSRAGEHGGGTWHPRPEGAATGGGARRSVEEHGGR
jgi:hypothetical protein